MNTKPQQKALQRDQGDGYRVHAVNFVTSHEPCNPPAAAVTNPSVNPVTSGPRQPAVTVTGNGGNTMWPVRAAVDRQLIASQGRKTKPMGVNPVTSGPANQP
jgi:hypothetical protein